MSFATTASPMRAFLLFRECRQTQGYEYGNGVGVWPALARKTKTSPVGAGWKIFTRYIPKDYAVLLRPSVTSFSPSTLTVYLLVLPLFYFFVSLQLPSQPLDTNFLVSCARFLLLFRPLFLSTPFALHPPGLSVQVNTVISATLLTVHRELWSRYSRRSVPDPLPSTDIITSHPVLPFPLAFSLLMASLPLRGDPAARLNSLHPYPPAVLLCRWWLNRSPPLIWLSITSHPTITLPIVFLMVVASPPLRGSGLIASAPFTFTPQWWCSVVGGSVCLASWPLHRVNFAAASPRSPFPRLP